MQAAICMEQPYNECSVLLVSCISQRGMYPSILAQHAMPQHKTWVCPVASKNIQDVCLGDVKKHMLN